MSSSTSVASSVGAAASAASAAASSVQRLKRRPPRHPIVLLHGLYGTDFRGPEGIPWLQIKYWRTVIEALEDKVGCKVHSVRVPGTASIEERARVLDRALQERFAGQEINLLAHSLGGLDARAVLTPDGPYREKRRYRPLSLTTLSTPHRGSPFMDWCRDVLGLGMLEGRPLGERQTDRSSSSSSSSAPTSPTSSADLNLLARAASLTGKGKPLLSGDNPFTKAILKVVDSPAYANLTTSYCREEFNPRTRDDADVAYFSYGASHVVSLVHPLYFPQMVVTAAEGPENDGLVSIESAKWGEYLGTMPCDHWEIRGQRGLAINIGLDKINLAALSMGWSSAGRMVETLNSSLGDLVRKVPWLFTKDGRKPRPAMDEGVGREFESGSTDVHPYADESLRAEIISLNRLAHARQLLDQREREESAQPATAPPRVDPWNLEEAYARMASRLYDAGF